MNKIKEKRIIKRLINTLFKPQAFIVIKSIEDLGKLDDILGQELKLLNGSVCYISTDTRKSLREITKRICIYYELEDITTFSELYSNVKDVYAKHLCNLKENEDMMEEVNQLTLEKIADYNHIVCCSGVSLEGIQSIDCGNYKIIQNSLDLFINAYGKDDEHHFGMMNKYFWILGKEVGSEKKSLEKFDYKTNLLTGFLQLCAQTINTEKILKGCIQALNSASIHRGINPRLQWKDESKGGSFSYSLPALVKFNITPEIIEYFKENLFFDSFFEILDKKIKTDVEEAICKSVYWFAEATKDNNNTMKFIKLWSCIECFFTITKDEISEANAKGLSSILVYGGYRIHNVEDYSELKRTIKALYSKRSKALHRAYWSEIDEQDVIELANWASWLIITVIALSTDRNYTRLSEIQEQAIRLDNIHNRLS